MATLRRVVTACLMIPIAAAVGASGAHETKPPISVEAAPVQGCDSIDFGLTYDVSVEALNAPMCFQFVTGVDIPRVKINAFLGGLPVDQVRDVHLIRVASDGSTVAVDADVSSDSGRLLQVASGSSTRWLLMVSTEGMPFGSGFQMQVDAVAGIDRYEPNDSPRHAAVLSGSQHIEASLDSPYDVDYYVITTRNGLTSARLFASMPVGAKAEVFLDNTWKAMPASGVADVPASSNSPLIVRVHSPDGTAAAGARYTFRNSDPVMRTAIAELRSHENITHMAPGAGTTSPVPGGANAAREMDVTASVYESDGNTPVPAGEPVTLVAVDYDPETGTSVTLAEVTGHTNSRGDFKATLDIGDCRGPGIQGPIRMHRPSNRPEYWDITYVPTAYVMAIVGDKRSKSIPAIFQHVCKEEYRGYGR